MSYQKTLTKLFDLQKFGIKVGLDTTRSLLASLADPQKNQAFVHIAGTNGKGSTAATLAAILTASGYRTGLYASPHLVTFRERISLDGQMIDETVTLDLFERVWAVIDETKPPTFFEFVTAMAFLYFQDQKPDLVILEAGLGGRLDSTNVVDPLATAITNISLEHAEHLGATIGAIAKEKAGIIKPNVPFVAGRLVPEALEVILARLKETSVKGLFLGSDFNLTLEKASRDSLPTYAYQSPSLTLNNLSLSLAGPHQVDNAALALALLETLNGLGYPLKPAAVAAGLKNVRWPGRCQRVEPFDWPLDGSGQAPLILDGAHNPGGAVALSQYLDQAKAEKIHLVVGVMADKDVAGVLGPLVPKADYLYLTRPEYDRAAAPTELYDRLVKALGPLTIPTEIRETIPLALKSVAQKANPQDLVVVSGSLFTVGETLAYLTGQPVVEPN
jgi:dihydrofolate synthase/folylpolyglutamate synthase